MDHDPEADPAGIVIEALSREDGKNATIRVYRDRIEWIKAESISSLPRPKDQPPVIPLRSVAWVKARRDGPLFSKVLLRTDAATHVFRMYSPQAVQVRDAIAELLAAGPPAMDEVRAPGPAGPEAPSTAPGGGATPPAPPGPGMPTPVAGEEAAPAAPAGPEAAGAVDDDLRQLEWLRDEGMLSTEQFEAAKARLGRP